MQLTMSLKRQFYLQKTLANEYVTIHIRNAALFNLLIAATFSSHVLIVITHVLIIDHFLIFLIDN